MAIEITLPDCSIEAFRNGFLTKADYMARVDDMTIQQKLFDRQFTNLLEENLHKHIVAQALIKIGAGGLMVTSYLISSDSSVTAYLSYGGKRLQLTAEGRQDDIGYFLTASSTGNGIRLRIESKRDHYKLRTWAGNAFGILLGLLFGVIPGILFAIAVIFFEPHVVRKKIDKFIVPAVESTFGRVKIQ